MGRYTRESWARTSQNKKIFEIAEIIASYYETEGLSKRLTDGHIKKKLGVTPLDLQLLKDEAVKKYFRPLKKLLISPRNKKLEDDLVNELNQYSLSEAWVFDTETDSITDTLSGVGKIAAEYFNENVKTNDRLVFSCGSTINQMITNLDCQEEEKDLTLYSSIVLCKNKIEALSPPSLIHNFSQKLKRVEAFTFHLPEEIKLKLSTEDISRMLDNSIFSEALSSDYFFLGIGALSKKKTSGLSGGFISTVKQLGCYEAFEKRGCCGEISYCPIVESKGVDSPWLIDQYLDRKDSDQSLSNYFDHVYTLDFKKLIEKKLKNEIRGKVIAIASGIDKTKSIKTCIEIKGFIDVLITDSKTADAVLSLNKTHAK